MVNEPNEKCTGCIYKETFFHGFGVGMLWSSCRCKVLQDMSAEGSCEWRKEKEEQDAE